MSRSLTPQDFEFAAFCDQQLAAHLCALACGLVVAVTSAPVDHRGIRREFGAVIQRPYVRRESHVTHTARNFGWL